MVILKGGKSHRLAVITCDLHANQYLNARKRLEEVEKNKMVPSLSLRSCESSVSVTENGDRKNKIISFVV